MPPIKFVSFLYSIVTIFTPTDTIYYTLYNVKIFSYKNIPVKKEVTESQKRNNVRKNVASKRILKSMVRRRTFKFSEI